MKRLLVLILLFSNVLVSQINKGAFDDYLYFVNQARTIYEGVEGSPYLTKDFVAARIDGYEKVVNLRLNIYAPNIEFKKPDGEIMILSLDRNYKFQLLNAERSKYEIHQYLDVKNNQRKSFFKRIDSAENYQLFLKHNVRFTPKKIATSGFEQNQPAKFTKRKDVYYLKDFDKKSNDLISFPTAKKDLKSIFGEKDKDIVKLIKKENLKLSNQEDIIKILRFYFNENQ